MIPRCSLSLVTRRAGLAAAGLSLAAASGLVSAVLAQPKPAAPAKPAAKPAARASDSDQPLTTKFGDTVVSAEQIDYDLEKKQYIFSTKVDLVTKTSHMTANKMTVQLNGQNQMQWTKCEGDVTLERKNPEDGTALTGRGRVMEYYEVEQKANLQGDCVVNQISPRLARPAVITGSRIDMDLKTKVNLVHRGPQSQARAHVEPKGEEGKPAPEPADLVGDVIEQNGTTQEYVATGQPMMVRPSSKLRAKTIRFQVDGKTNDIKVAYAEENVVYDGQSERGSIIHCTGDRGEYRRDDAEMVMEGKPDGGGTVHATVKEPDEEKPTIYQGIKFIYNTRTGARRLAGKPASVIIPDRPKKTAPADGGTPAPSAPKEGADGNEAKK